MRLKFFLAFFISLLAGIVSFLIVNGVVRTNKMDFSDGIQDFTLYCKPLMEDIKETYFNKGDVQQIINDNFYYYDPAIEVFITDKSGNVLLAPANNHIKKIQIDLAKEANKAYNTKSNRIRYYDFQPIDDKHDIIVSGIIVKRDETSLILVGIIVSILTFILLTYSWVNYVSELSNVLKEIAKGNLNCKADVKGRDEFSLLAQNINYMTSELKMQKEVEEQIEKSKKELIINISHDLRTPLTSIIGYTKLLKEKYKQDETVNKYIDIIDEKSHRLQILIDDLFEYTLITGSEVVLEKAMISLNELLRQVVEGMLPFSAQHGVSIAYNAPGEEVIIEIDAVKAARVFENILTNAIKYSRKPDTVDVSLYVENRTAVCRIFNRGKTLAENELLKIFDKFYRTDAARNSGTGGFGIGLSIAKEIVELHKGKIWGESTIDGIAVYVSLNL